MGSFRGGKTMKFITLTDANQETRKYTISVNNITCIETYVNDDGSCLHGYMGTDLKTAKYV